MGWNMNDDFLIWDSAVVPNACCLAQLVNVDDQFELPKGIRRAAAFPSEAAFTMDPDFPNDTLLTDNLVNTDRLVVVSPKLKAFLESQRLAKVEYLPVTILNHKGRPASRDYFIVHPVDLAACVDTERSDVEWSVIDPTSIDSATRLVIDETALDPEVALFRPRPFYDVVLVRRPLAEAIDAQRFSGIRWIELSSYPEL
jgi:hypothetical protein